MSDVFRRDLDRIEVPADAIWVPARRRRSPIGSLLAIAGAAALVVAAAVGGSVLRVDDIGGPSASVPGPAAVPNDAFDVFIGGTDGSVHVVHDLQLDRSIEACGPSTNAVSIAGALDDRTLLVRCAPISLPGGNSTRTPQPRVPDVWVTVRVDNSDVRTLDVLTALQPDSLVLSPGRDQALLRFSSCSGVPGRCTYRLAIATLATNEIRTILDASEDAADLRWTVLGVTISRRLGERGTYLYESGSWRKIGERRLLDADATGRMLLGDDRQLGTQLGSAGAIWERTAAGERALTDGKHDAYGIALVGPNGALVVSVLDGTHIKEFRDGREVRSTKGGFCTTAERFRDWFVCMPSTTTEDRVAMYSVGTGEHRVATVKLPLRSHGTAIAVLPRGPVTRSLGTSIGALRLGADLAEVRSLLGPPARETFGHGQGGPEWQYANGTIVRFATTRFTVWQIIIRAESAGRTAENFGIGDSREAFAHAYREFPVSPGVPVDQVQINSGGFGPGGRTLSVTFTSGRASVISLTSSLAQ